MIRRKPGSGTAFEPRTGIWLLLATVLALFTIFISQLSFFTPVQNAALATLAPAQRALSAVVNPVDDFLVNFGDFGAIQKESEQLRLENERLSVEIAALREKEASYRDLSRLLDVKSLRPEDKFIQASIIARSAGRYEHAVALNRGAKDGIATGLVVFAPGGSVVGRVTSVMSDFAWVTLITDPASKVPALLPDERSEGILTGRADDSMRLELLPQGSAVRPGDIIVTSGLGGQFPKGLPVGKVVEVGGSNHDLFPTVYVEPLVSLRSLENVLILTSYRTDGVPAYGSASAAADATPTATPTSAAGSSERRPAESVLPGGAR